jgi:hypothetical protein
MHMDIARVARLQRFYSEGKIMELMAAIGLAILSADSTMRRRWSPHSRQRQRGEPRQKPVLRWLFSVYG